MANTGYIIYTYKDTNPYSETYGHTKEERVYDTELCPIDIEPRPYKVLLLKNGVDDYTQTCGSDNRLDLNAICDNIETTTAQSYVMYVGDCTTTIYDSVKHYGDIMVRNYNIVKIDMANNYVTTIDKYGLSGLQYVTNIILSKNIITIGDNAFQSNKNWTNSVVLNKVKTIGKKAFHYCNSLTDITLGADVTTIGQEAFNSCYNLVSFTIKATTPPTLGTSAFGNINNLTIYVPDESVDAYKTATNWSNYFNKIKPLSEKE